MDARGLVDAASVASFITSLPAVKAAYPEIVNEIEKKKSNIDYISPSNQINQLSESIIRLQKISPHISFDYLLGLTPKTTIKLQQKLHSNIKNNRTKRVIAEIENSGMIPHAILQSSSGYQASAWLQAQPTGNMKMTNDEFENSIRNRLAMNHPYIKPNTECIDKCKVIHDSRGVHADKCKCCHSQTIATHNTITQCFTSLSKAAQCSATNTCTDLLDDGKELDILIIDGVEQDTGLDIRITNPIDAAIERGTRKHPPIKGELAARSAKEKCTKFQERCKKKDINFIPIILETQGLWGEATKVWFKKMILKQSRACNVPSSSLTIYWTQLISVALQKKVSKAQINTMNRVNAIRHLNKYEDAESYLYDNHQEWERQGSRDVD